MIPYCRHPPNTVIVLQFIMCIKTFSDLTGPKNLFFGPSRFVLFGFWSEKYLTRPEKWLVWGLHALGESWFSHFTLQGSNKILFHKEIKLDKIKLNKMELFKLGVGSKVRKRHETWHNFGLEGVNLKYAHHHIPSSLPIDGTWENLRKNVDNMKKYEENMKKYEKIWRKMWKIRRNTK